MSKTKIVIGLIVLVALMASAYTLVPEKQGHSTPTPNPTDGLMSFDSACFVHPGESAPRCEPTKLTEVLESRAATPQYKKFIDPASGISFEYPSSIATVRSVDGRLFVEPMVPSNLGTDYWRGMSISLEECDAQCSKDLVQYVGKWNIRSGTDTHETVSTISPNISIGGRGWVQASVGTPMGASYTLYASVVGGKLLSVTTDTDNFTTTHPAIAAAFNKVLETVTR